MIQSRDRQTDRQTKAHFTESQFETDKLGEEVEWLKRILLVSLYSIHWATVYRSLRGDLTHRASQFPKPSDLL